MGRFLSAGFFRKIDKQYINGDISHSKMLEMIENEVIKNYHNVREVMEYRNRHRDKFQFNYNENGNIDWTGQFRYTRCGFDMVRGEEILLYIDPSGGPFIGVDTDMSHFGLEGIVTGFVNHGDYYEILIDNKK